MTLNTGGRSSLGMLGSVAIGLLACGTESRAEGQRDWAVSDSVAVRYVARSQTFAGRWARVSSKAPDPIVWSPDKRYFFFMTYRGDIARDCPEHEVRIYNADAVRKALQSQPSAHVPRPLHRVKGCGYQEETDKQGIPDAHWADDSASIVFTTVTGRGPRQVHRLDIATGQVRLLSAPDHDVFQYESRGDGIVYSVARFKPDTYTLHEYPSAVGSRSFIKRALDLLPGRRLPNRFEIFAKYGDASPTRIASAYDWEPPGAHGETKRQNTWISPNGRLAIVLRSVAEPAVPSSWLSYDGLRASSDTEDRTSNEWYQKTRRFLLVDLVDGTSHPIVDAPAGLAVMSRYSSSVLWFSDSSRAIVINTALPLDKRWKERESTSYLLDYSVADDTWLVLDSLARDVKSVSWSEQDRAVKVESLEGEHVYRLHDRVWKKEVAVGSHIEQGGMQGGAVEMTVKLREGANQPPQVIATLGGRSLNLLEPDPVLRDVYRAPVQEVQWREGKKLEKGGLIMPRRREGGERVPLVIQAYSWIPDQFLPDGTASSAYAAQALAAQGIAVLLVGIPTDSMTSPKDVETFDYTQEGPTFVNRIDAAVRYLAQEGLVDEQRVGAVGFSRGGYNVLYAITHPKEIALTAAVIADSTTLSYSEYLSAVGESGGDTTLRGLYESQYGNKTFWQDKETWLKTDPLFNLDRARTPTFMMYHGASAPRGVGEILGAFILSDVPHDVLFFPRGTHQLRMPREREASLQATVDWMSFWLLEKLPSDSERAKRWKALRKTTTQ
jgi:hypothetical protein